MRSDSWPMRLWKLAYPILIQTGISLAVVTAIGSIIVSQLTAANSSMGGDQIMDLYIEKMAEYNVLITLVVDLIIAAILFIFFRRDSKRLQPIHKKTRLVHWMLITAMGLMGCLAGNFIITLSGLPELFPEIYEELAQLQYSGSILLEIVALGIMAPIMEELLFRGLIFRRLRTYCRFPAAMVLSAVVFGLCHGNMLQFVYAFLLGLILAFLYERFRTIYAPMLFHGMANLFSVMISEVPAVGNFLEQYIWVFIVASFTIIIAGVYFLNNTLKPEEEKM